MIFKFDNEGVVLENFWEENDAGMCLLLPVLGPDEPSGPGGPGTCGGSDNSHYTQWVNILSNTLRNFINNTFKSLNFPWHFVKTKFHSKSLEFHFKNPS